MRVVMAVGLTGILLVGVFLAGCSNNVEEQISGSANEVTTIASVYPADGATGVPRSTSIAIRFSGPVDTLSVMNNLHLSGGQPMHEWYDSLGHYGGFGMMNMAMANHMMNWMDSIQTPGHYSWNDTRDSCQFVPDSELLSNADYLCLLYEDGMNDGHGGMMGGSHPADSGYYMYGFTTSP